MQFSGIKRKLRQIMTSISDALTQALHPHLFSAKNHEAEKEHERHVPKEPPKKEEAPAAPEKPAEPVGEPGQKVWPHPNQ